MSGRVFGEMLASAVHTIMSRIRAPKYRERVRTERSQPQHYVSVKTTWINFETEQSSPCPLRHIDSRFLHICTPIRLHTVLLRPHHHAHPFIHHFSYSCR